MDLDLGRDEMVIVGASPGVLRWLGEQLPPGSVVLVEEHDVIRRRGIDGLVAELSAVSRMVPAEYQTGLAVDALLDRDPGLTAARLVMPGLEYAVAAAARLAQRLGLPGAGVDAADIFSDKHRMRLLADAAGLANPAYELVVSPARAAALAGRWGGRCVLKPTRRAGSLGVQLITDPAEIARAWAATADSEWIVADGMPTLVECAARLPGDMITALISVAYEFDFVGAYLRVLAGQRPPLPAAPTAAAAVEFLLAPPGTVTAVEGVRQAQRVPGVLQVQLAVAVGDTVGEARSSPGRSGHLLVWGAGPAQAASAARKAAEQIRFTVR